MQKILVWTSDTQLFLFLRHILARESFHATLASLPHELPDGGEDDEYSAAILEPTTAGTEGVARYLLHAVPDLPLIVFSRESQAPDWFRPRDLLLDHPFDPHRLIAFLGQLRGTGSAGSSATVWGERLQAGDLVMDLARMRVYRAGREVPLTALQFRLLRRLLQTPSRVCDRDDLIQNCWPEGTDVEPRTVDIHISHIRRVLVEYGPDPIRTVRGCGYALHVPFEDDGSC